MPITREQALDALSTVNDPELFKDIVSLNMVKRVDVDGDKVSVTVELTTPACPMKEKIEADVTAALMGAGAAEVEVELTADTRSSVGQGPMKDNPLPQVRNVIAVGAGKGGVGKSTVSVNLAVALQRAGAQVGLMDGDIFGPSLPTMLGIKGSVPRVVDKSKILPHHVHGIHAVTIGSLVEADKPLIWRGPMAHGAFKQLAVDNTKWPELDYVIVDLPPGTGDVPLTLCQLLPLTGAVVVATPQQVALDDALRAVRMFQQLECPVLGMVENMSYLVTDGGEEIDLFGRGGVHDFASQMDLELLGTVPLYPSLRINSDRGKPHANFEGAGPGEAFEKLAGQVAAAVARRAVDLTGTGPTLTVS